MLMNFINDLQGTFCIKTTGLKGFHVQITPGRTDQKDLDGDSDSKMIMLLLLQFCEPSKFKATNKTVTLEATANHIRLQKRLQWNNGV